MLKVFRLLSVFLGWRMWLNLPCCAQQALGAINGTVTDSSGAVVAKATVKVRNTGTNLEQTATTKDDGSFSVPDLPIGTYEVRVSREAFGAKRTGSPVNTIISAIRPVDPSVS